MMQPTRQQPTSPIRLKALRRELLADLARREQIADEPTRQLSSIPRPVNLTPITAPTLPKDEQGREYLRLINPFESTVDLVEAAVQRFRECTGRYPTVIMLSALRYVSMFFLNANAPKHYYPKDIHAQPIPYEAPKQGGTNYDVFVH